MDDCVVKLMQSSGEIWFQMEMEQTEERISLNGSGSDLIKLFTTVIYECS
jgi:hypothetical protein